MIDSANELLTTDQLAERLHVKARTVQEWSRTGRIPAVRISAKVVRYDWCEIMKALRSQREASHDR